MALGEDSPGDYEEKLAGDNTYVVQRGDTLAGVALRLGVKKSELKRANRMYGSRTLVAGQVLKTSGPARSTDGGEAPTAPPTNARRTQFPLTGFGDARSGSPRAAGMSATSTGSVVVAEDGVVVEPPLEEEIEQEEIWFEEGRREQAGAGAGARMGSSRSIGSAGSSSSLMPPIGETNAPLPPMLSPASGLLYEPPQWGGIADFGGGGGGGGSRSRQASDASSTASAAAAAAGASVRDMFKYVRSKAAALATTATAATYYGSDDNANAVSGSNKPAAIGATRASRQRRADSISSQYSSSGGDGNNNGGGSSTASGVGGSLPTTPGVPNVDEALPPAELWGGERKEAAKAAACAAAQAEAREVSEAAQRAARDASNASNASTQSTTQTLLSMVRPSYWRSTSSEGAGAGAGGEAAAVGKWGGGGGGSGRTLGGCDNERGSVGLDLPVDESMAGSFHPAFAGGVSPRAREAEAAPPRPPAPLKLPGLVCGGSTIVTHSTLARMDAAQPKHHRGYNWFLLFSTLRDGASYTTLYNRIKAEDPTFLLVENMKGEVFGGFASSAWASGSQYYGTGECFLFKIDGERITVASDNPEGDDDSDDGAATKTLVEGEISAYGWTGMNMYLQYSDAEGMGMGGGGADGSFGLFIGEDFLSGSTGRCDTYGNPPLCSEQQFQVSQVEIWGFTTADTEMGARLERLRKTLRGKTTRPL
eukprot:g7827.t1